MEYFTLATFGALGLAFAIASQITLVRSRRSLEAAEQSIVETTMTVEPAPDQRTTRGDALPQSGLKLKAVYIPRSGVSGRVLSAKRTPKPAKTK